jgi:putative addiction module CopG family antidote
LEDFVSSQVNSGEFGDASEVVGEALRLLQEEQERKTMEEMRAIQGVGMDYRKIPACPTNIVKQKTQS